MKKNKRILAMLLLLLFMGTALWTVGKKYYELERATCFKRLAGYTEQIGQEIQKACREDWKYLQQISEIFAQFDLTNREEAGKMLSLLEGKGMITRLEILLPGDQLLTEKGRLIDVSGKLSFQTEAQGTAHISKRERDLLFPDVFILRYTVPIERDEQVIGILCGVMDLSELPQKITAIQEYSDRMQYYIVEGSTGNFLHDTWNDTLGSINELGSRQTKKGYDWGEFIAGQAQGVSRAMIFLSKNTGEYCYSYSAPVGVEDWMVTLLVPERVAFAHAEKILFIFYILAGSLLAIFLFYFAWMLWDNKREKENSAKQLKNVRYMLEVEKELFNAHVQPDHFTKALKRAAEFLTAEIAFCWLLEGPPNMERCIWSSQENRKFEQDGDFPVLFPGLFSILQKEGGLLSYNMADLSKEFPAGSQNISRFGIRNVMLIPVTGVDGELTAILGACNMECQWESLDPLEQVALSFSMAINHHGAYQSLARMGKLDSLTGLMNRNSYHFYLETLSHRKHQSIACVYMDVNGLHEINNHLGHKAGDQMLQTVADELKSVFAKSNVYRIGGDEFVILCQDQPKEDILHKTDLALMRLEQKNYRLSVGIEWRDQNFDMNEIVNAAEKAMQKNKREYYEQKGNVRQLRALDRRLEQMLVEKQDADAFLTVLAPEFKGVYFVNLNSDTIRHLYNPSYFEVILKKTGDRFKSAMLMYAQHIVKPEYYDLFEKICDYEDLAEKLNSDVMPEFVYEKKNGEWLQLRILKFKNYTEECRETLWIFTNMNLPKET